jgi:hypothetical protein
MTRQPQAESALRGAREKENQMRVLILSGALLFFGAQERMVAPKVEHKKRTETQTHDDVTRSCPAGYEGHFVDIQPGFDSERWISQTLIYRLNQYGAGELGYTICFKKEFMDEIRKNPELLAPRPAPPKGV